jgi:hypothetical protein
MSFRKSAGHHDRGTTLAKQGTASKHQIDQRGIMKRLLGILVLATAIAAAALAGAGWSRPPEPVGCDEPAQSELPITAALQLWRCGDATAAGASR